MRLPVATLRRAACGLVVALAATLSLPAAAECQRTYTSQELVSDLSVMTSALRAGDEVQMTTTGGRMEAGLACIRTKVPAQVFANAYRFIGAGYFLRDEQPKARRWFRASLEISPTYEFDVGEVPLDHPMRAFFEATRASAGSDPVVLEGKELALPSGSTLYLDGRKLTRPEATVDRPHLLQVIAESDGSVRQAFLIDGNAIPAQYLRDAGDAVAAADKGEKGDKGGHQPNYDLSVVKVQRVRPAAKTPLMISGGVIALAAGGIYGASFATRNQFDAASTTADLERTQRLTNTLVVASGATLLVGLGVEYAGIMLGATGNGFRVHGQF